MIGAADVVFADMLALRVVSRARPQRVRELRLLSSSAVERIKGALEIVAPPARPGAKGRAS